MIKCGFACSLYNGWVSLNSALDMVNSNPIS